MSIFLLCLCPAALTAAEKGTPDEIVNIPWSDNAITEFPRQYLGWWDSYSDPPPLGIQILPTGLIITMDRNPINREIQTYRVVRVIDQTVYMLVSIQWGKKETRYQYISLHFYPDKGLLAATDDRNIMQLREGATISKHEFETLSNHQLWDDLRQRTSESWSSSTYIR